MTNRSDSYIVVNMIKESEVDKTGEAEEPKIQFYRWYTACTQGLANRYGRSILTNKIKRNEDLSALFCPYLNRLLQAI